MTNEDAPDIAKVDGQPSSKTIDQRSPRASGKMVEDDGAGPPQGPDGSGALLGLKPAASENKQENADQIEQTESIEVIFPLLGTNSLKSLNKLSQTRSSERVCYDSLLRFGAHSSSLSIGKTVRNGPRGLMRIGFLA